MGLPRFLVPAPELTRSPVRLTGAEYRHFRVRRLKVGDRCVLTDGARQEVQATVEAIGQGYAQLRAAGPPAATLPFGPRVVLVASLIRPERLDWTIQKSTELGVAEIHLARGERSQGSRGSERLDRWRKIANEAAKQSGQARVPAIEAPAPLVEVFRRPLPTPRFLCDSGGPPPLEALPVVAPAGLTLVVGPEGGFTPTETLAASDAGYGPLSLGGSTLRAETAAVVAVAFARLRWGCAYPDSAAVPLFTEAPDEA